MKKYTRLALLVLITSSFFSVGSCQSGSPLKIVIIRHGEKPANGDNLTCQGLNRSLGLPKVLYSKFGVATAIFVPAINGGSQTKSGRMFQTITPYAVKYNLQINSKYEEDDYKKIIKDVTGNTGTVLMVWEHSAIPSLVKALGVKGSIRDWPGNDFDSIWIITYKNGKALITRDSEGLKPSEDCPF